MPELHSAGAILGKFTVGGAPPKVKKSKPATKPATNPDAKPTAMKGTKKSGK